MKEKTKKAINKLIEEISDIPFVEVLEAISILSVQIYICAPEGTVNDALDCCHDMQKQSLKRYLDEKENKKAVLDKSIIEFNQFAREPDSKAEDAKETI